MSVEFQGKMPPIEGKVIGCLCCGGNHDTFAPDSIVAVGFGYAAVTKDGTAVYEERALQGAEDYMTGAQAETIAAADPDHDWRIVKDGPLKGATYQRHGPGHWVLVEENIGFA